MVSPIIMAKTRKPDAYQSKGGMNFEANWPPYTPPAAISNEPAAGRALLTSSIGNEPIPGTYESSRAFLPVNQIPNNATGKINPDN